MKMNTLYAALSGAFLLGTAALAPAQTRPAPRRPAATLAHPIKNAKVAVSADYRADKEAIEAEYKAAKAKCKSMSGNAKDVCMKEAKGNEKVAKAELEAKRKGTPQRHVRRAKVTKAKAHLRSREGEVRRPEGRRQERVQEAGEGRQGRRRWPKPRRAAAPSRRTPRPATPKK